MSAKMPLEELSTTKAHFYGLFESLSVRNFQVTKFPEFQNGLILGTGNTNNMIFVTEVCRKSSNPNLTVVGGDHLIGELSGKQFDSIQFIKYSEAGFLLWKSNPIWWEELFKKNFDSIFFYINQKSLLGFQNILEILHFSQTKAEIHFIDQNENLFQLSQEDCEQALNSISKIDRLKENEITSYTRINEKGKARILFDGRVLSENSHTGIHRYANELLKALPSKISEIDIQLIGCQDYPIPEGVAKIPLSLPLSDHDRAEKIVGLSSTVEQSDLIYSPYYPLPRKREAKTILTIHDLIPIVHPEWFNNPSTIRFFEKNLRESAKCVDKIIAVSHCTKRDIIKFYDIEEEKIEVIHLAPSSIFKNTQNCNFPFKKDVPKIVSYNRPYFLSVATLEPRKNLVRTIKAFELFRDSEKNLESALLLVGKSGWKNEELLKTYTNSRYKDSIFFTGYLSDEALISVYQDALAFIYPSLYEGFGLPVLEAMSSGVPVITSNNSSLAEIAVDAALCCDPYSVEEIAVSMARIAKSQTLRQNLAALGIQRSNKFSWKKTAQETANVFLSCLS
jgi:glycosyltransferase involved in cell wall biosynthesis